jgi:hypothetical protein
MVEEIGMIPELNSLPPVPKECSELIGCAVHLCAKENSAIVR